MIARLARIPTWIITNVWARVHPESYARAAGVQLGAGVTFYGLSPKTFGTEPWLIRIGNHSHITAGCQFLTHDGGTLALRWKDPTLEVTAPIILGERVYLGVNTLILPGVTIGSNVIVGAGSVVTKDIADNTVAAGVPARPLKTLDQYHNQIRSASLGLGAFSATDKKRALRRHFADFLEGR